MRIPIFFLIFCALISSAAVASPIGLDADPGRMLTVRVGELPETAALAVCDLGPEVGEVTLRRDGDIWTGSFALLPDLVADPTDPQVKAYGVDGEEISVKGCTVGLASSTFDQAGLADVLADRNVRFVFGNNIAANTIWFSTRDGVAVPERDGQTFVVPFGVAPLTVNAIGARTVDGQTMVVEPDWLNSDIATTEEELELLSPTP